MSVICCKVTDQGITVSSDSITVLNNTQNKGDNLIFNKLSKIKEIVIGGVGGLKETFLLQTFINSHEINGSTCEDIFNFMIEFSSWKEVKIGNGEIENDYILVFKSKAFVMEGYLVREIKTYEAIGAGRQFALAAMHLGHSTEDAVKVACELCTLCEEPVMSFTEAA